ncbi:MAG: site-2 protease family protein [Alphaproteobacteria bacterium]|nr:site-2 protease family protein [Alphaproteobacteria bacterium]
MPQTLYIASVWILPVLLAITLHEAAHGWVAWKLGDNTAKSLGRVTFNPLKHIDSFGTVVLPGMLLLSGAPFLFGWAKPVPVDIRRLRDMKRGMVLVAAAGPASNLIIAYIAALMFHLVQFIPAPFNFWVAENLANALTINIVLAVFNMAPIPPLDGGRVAIGLLPRVLAIPLARLERYGIFILIGVLFGLPFVGDLIGVNLNVFPWLVGAPVQFLSNVIAQAAGVI